MPSLSMTKSKQSLVYKVTGDPTAEQPAAGLAESAEAAAASPRYQLLVEGDSWANILWPFSKVLGFNQAFPDIIREDARFRTNNIGHPGDTFEQIIDIIGNPKGIYQPIQSGIYDFLILSGGGNDFLGGGALKDILLERQAQLTHPFECLDRAKVDKSFAKVRQGYEYLIKCVNLWSPRTRTLLHGYDHAIPRLGGRWLGEPFSARGYNADSKLCADIVRVLVDRFYEMLKQLDASNPKVHLVDVRGACRDHWHDELHPDEQAARLIARRFTDTMLGAAGGAVTESLMASTEAPMANGSVDKLVQLGSSNSEIRRIHRIAAGYMSGSGVTFPTRSCAATLSAFLQQAGFEIRTELGAQNLANQLRHKGWNRVEIGRQRPGDIGVTISSTPPPGADHIYLVVKVHNSDRMEIADNQAPTPHERFASGRGKTRTEYFLRAPGMEMAALGVEATSAVEEADYAPFPLEDEDTNGLPEVAETESMLAGASASALDEDLVNRIAQRVADILADRLAK